MTQTINSARTSAGSTSWIFVIDAIRTDANDYRVLWNNTECTVRRMFSLDKLWTLYVGLTSRECSLKRRINYRRTKKRVLDWRMMSMTGWLSCERRKNIFPSSEEKVSWKNVKSTSARGGLSFNCLIRIYHAKVDRIAYILHGIRTSSNSFCKIAKKYVQCFKL